MRKIKDIREHSLDGFEGGTYDELNLDTNFYKSVQKTGIGIECLLVGHMHNNRGR